MTKKSSEKSKAWEKDRRDRLNKTFEELAKLLPKYDPSIAWSKIEIIQKSILHIKELHERHENYLRDKDPETLNQQSDLIDALNYYQSRNGQLAKLLKRAKITLPQFKLPKFLIDNPQHQQFKNGHKKSKQHTTTTPTSASEAATTPAPINNNNNNSKNELNADKNDESLNSDKTVENKIEKSLLVEKEKDTDTGNDNDNNNSTDNINDTQNNNASNDNNNDSVNRVISVKPVIEKSTTQTHQKSIDQTVDQVQINNVTQQKAIITTAGILVPLVPLQTLQTTNPNITIPLPVPQPPPLISSSTSVQHIIDISLPATNIVTNNITNPTIPRQISTFSNSSLALPLPLAQPSVAQSTTAAATTTFIKLPITTTTLNSLTLQKLAHRLIGQNPKRVYRKIARDKDGKIKILPQPRLKIYFQRSDGKVPIPVLKRSNNIPIMKRKRRRQKRKASTSIIENSDDRNTMTTSTTTTTTTAAITDECKNENKKQKLEEQCCEHEITNITNDITEKIDPIEVDIEKSIENNFNDNNDTLKPNQIEKTENLNGTEDKFNDSNLMNANEEKTETNDCLKIAKEHGEQDNSSLIHASVINNEKCVTENGSVSPTAAFLLSFPVVTTTSTTTTTTTTTTVAITASSIDEKSMNLGDSSLMDIKEKSDYDLKDSSTENVFGENKQNITADVKNSEQNAMEVDEPDSNSISDEIGKVYPLIPVTTENQQVTTYPPMSDTFHQNFESKCQTTKSNGSISSNDQCQSMKIEPTSNCSTVPATANESLQQNVLPNMVSVSSTFSPAVTSLYNVMPICTPLPLHTTIGMSSTMSSIVNSTLPENLPLEPLMNPNCKPSTSVAFPDAIGSSYLKNTNTPIVETTWCSLTTIPSVETVQKSSDTSAVLSTNINSNQNVNTFVGLGGTSQMLPITTINSNNHQINTQPTTLNSQLNMNPTSFVPPINTQSIVTEIPKLQPTKVTFTTASITKTTTPRATTSRRQNSRANAKLNTTIVTTTPLMQTGIQPTILTTSSSNISQQNLTTNVVSSVSTAFSSVPPSNHFYSNNLQMNNNAMPHPSYSEPLPHNGIFNQNPPIMTNPYSNFPVPNSFSPMNTINDPLQNYSRTVTNQFLKQPTTVEKNLIPTSQPVSEGMIPLVSSKSENNLINTSRNNTNYGSQNKFSNASFVPPIKYENVPQVSQMNVPQSRSENITSIPQSKSENFVYPTQSKFENSNFLPQSKSNHYSQNSEPKANSNVTYVPQSRSSGIPYSSELPVSSDNNKISNTFVTQSQTYTSTNTSNNYPKPINTFSNTASASATTAASVFHSYSNATKHSQMYSPYHLPLNSSMAAPSTVTDFYPPSALNFQTSSIPNLPSNCAPIYPTTVNNAAPGDFISSLYVPNTFSRPPLTNSLPVHPIAKSTSVSPQMIQSTFTSSASSTNRLPIDSSPNNVSSAAFAIPSNTAAATTTSLYASQPTTFQKDSASPFHYPIAPSSTIIPNYLPPNSISNTMTSSIPLKQTPYTTSPSTLSSVYYPPLPTTISNVSNPNYSVTSSNLTSTINSKQPLKTISSSVSLSQNNVQSQNIKDNTSPSTSTASNSTTKQMSSFKSYQPKTQTNSQRNYGKQNNNNSSSNINTSMTLPMSSELFTSQNNAISKTTTDISYSQNTMTNSNNFSSSYNVTSSSAPTSAVQSKPKTPSGIDTGPTYPQTTSGYNRSALNYPPPSITPLPPPLLSTTLPVSNSSSLSNFHQNTFMDPPIDSLKYSTQSSTAPIQSYNRINQDSLPTSQSKSFNNRPMDPFISSVPTTPIYTHTSQTNLGYGTPNAFYPCGSDAIYSPAKNYYYHPLQDTSNFSFSLTSTTNSLPTVSSNNPPVTVQSYATSSPAKNEVAWMPPPRPSSVAPSFTFSLTPTTMTTSTSIVNTSTNNTTNRSTTQKANKSANNSKSKTNYNIHSSEVPKSTVNKVQLSSANNTVVSSNLATNFTFSLTNSKASFTNTESSIYGKSANVSNDFPQQKQHISGYDRYNTITTDQHKQNTPSTNFSFALTKTTTASSNSSTTVHSAQRAMSSTSSTSSSSASTSAVTTNSSSFTIDATLNQPNCYTAQNMNNSKVNSLTTTEQTHNSGVFKKPLVEPPPVKRSVTPLSNQVSTQSYYNAYDQKLQRPPQSSTPALHHQKAPVNWIAPSEFGAPHLMDYGCVPSYPPAQLPPQNFDYNNRKNDLYYHPSFAGNDDHFPSWSPNKMLDTTSHFASASTSLGNYYSEIPPFSGGGNSNNFLASSIPTSDVNKSSYSATTTSTNKTPSTVEKDFKNSRASTPSCNQNSNNFFSVSQLVDQETTTASNTSQKAYDNCSTANSGNSNSNTNSNSGNNNNNNNNNNHNNNNNSNNSTSNKKVSSSASKSKDSNKKFSASNSSVSYSSTATEQQQRSNVSATTNVGNVGNMTAITSNNYSTEALLTKKEKTIRNYPNINNPDYYGGMNTPSNALYPSSSPKAPPPPPPPLSSSLIVDNMDPNYFYNYPTNAGGCLPDTDYLGSIYPNDINYSRSQSIKPSSYRKLSSSTPSVVPPPPSPQPHHPSIPHHPPPSNFAPYDTANYYPVPLGVNSPLMPGPTAAHHHAGTDPYGSSGALVMPPTAATPHPYMHTPSPGNFQSHTWNPKVHNTPPTANSLHHQYQNLQESPLGHNQSQQQHHHHHPQHSQHLFPSEMNVNALNPNNINNNRITAHNQHQQHQQQHQQNQNLSNTNTTGTTGTGNAAGSGAVTSTGGNNPNSSATGNNLTNFNLTTICPEINNEKVGSNPW